MPITKKRPEKSSKKDAKASGKGNKAEESTLATQSSTEETLADVLRREGVIATYALDSKIMHKNVRDISVSNLTVTYHGTPIIDDAELTLNYGNRYGFIGRNGCGKSTFMRVIGARCFPIPEGIDIFHLKEEIEATDMTAKEAVMSVDVERAKLEAEVEYLNNVLTEEDHPDNNEDSMDRLTQLYERLEQLDAATAEVRACKILSGLGFSVERQNKKTKEFSGGWRMRIALARALFIQPTLLLLDEPTNHLDMEAVVWLEDYLSKWDKILFLVSHSQDFMNNVCTHIVHLHKKKLNYYTGNYDQFVQTRREKEEEQEKRYKAEQDQIKHMKDYVARFGQGNAKMARQAQSKEKTLDKMLRSGLTDKVETERVLDFKFLDPGKLSPPVLQCNNITFGYPNAEILYSGVDFGIDLDSRVALVGPNGAGKSTLLKIMTGDLQPLIGDVRPHAHLRISKFSQHFIDVLDLSMNPLDYFMQLWPDMTKEDARKFLGRYGISGIVQTQIMSQLSDGQKSRVVLAKMARENPHLLFLDEPTNHLDMESIDSLAKAINNFNGGMVLVSHDMRLISQVAQEIWVCDHQTVTKFVGEISDFKMQLRGQMQRANLMDGGSDNTMKSSLVQAPKLVPLTPMNTKNTNNGGGGGGSVKSGIPMNSKLSLEYFNSKNEPLTEEELIIKARLELAELAISKQRERQATTTTTTASGTAPMSSKPLSSTSSASSLSNVNAKEDSENVPETSVEEDEEQRKLEEKAAQKAKRKAEKEAQAALERREEEERQRRREEKLRDIEEAKKLKEEKLKEYEEFMKLKAEKDAKIKAEEEEEQRKQAEIIQKRKEEKEIRKLLRLQARLDAEEAVRKETEQIVLNDPWTQEQQYAFEEALLKYTIHSKYDKSERWNHIAACVEGKSRNQCIRRYKYLKDFIIKQRKLLIAYEHATMAASNR